jgi:hypothetical protein
MKIAESRLYKQLNKPHTERTYTFVADFCQNIALPHFGKKKPGDRYYLTPTSIYGFGFADVSHIPFDDGKPSDHLCFHCFKEGDGNKGGNNVASLIIKSLKKFGLLQVDGLGNSIRGKELNIVMDNCGGQNKNNHVILLAPYHVEVSSQTLTNTIPEGSRKHVQEV